MQFPEQFKAAYKNSTPLIAVRTFDAKSTIETIRAQKFVSNKVEKDVPFIKWDIIKGARGLNVSGEKSLNTIYTESFTQDATVNLPEFLRHCEMIEDEPIIFICNAHLFWNEVPIKQAIWNLRDTFKGSGACLVNLCNQGDVLPSELVQDVLILEQPLPTENELECIITDTFKNAKVTEPDAKLKQQAVNALIGLPSFPAEQSTAMCLDAKSQKLDVNELWHRKRTIIGQVQGLSFYTGNDSLADIGGLENIVEFLHAIMTGKDAPKVILRFDEVEKAFAGTGTDMSGVKTELTGSMASWMDGGGNKRTIEGLTFLGLPGVAKSNIIYAIANYYGIPCINFDLAAMQSSLVGSSGSNLRTAQATIDAISGGYVQAIATCNGIDTLPPEIRRRFGSMGTFFFDAPTAKERSAIWKIYLNKFNLDATQQLPDDAGWTGAEIRNCAKLAHRLNIPLVKASSYIVPVTKANAQRLDALRESSSNKFLSASHSGLYSWNKHSENTEPQGRKIKG